MDSAGTMGRKSIHGEWSSRWAFILAATGAAVGLGNVWKFPYIAGENGGGAFVLLYLFCIVLIGIPVMMGEILLGRRGRQNPANTMKTLAEESQKSPQWKWLGFIGIIASFMILSYYSVIAGWSFDYIFQAAAGHFNHQSAKAIDDMFDVLLAHPLTMIFWHTLLMGGVILIVGRGVQRGLEAAVRYMFPMMLILLIILLGYSMETGYFKQGLYFLFHPDFSKLTSEGFIDALGHAFFTLSLATGSIMMYGAYVPKNASVPKAALAIAFADTMVAIVSGLAIFPIVFANNLAPSSGPGLLFETLPIAFGQMNCGALFATLFFVMLVFAAFTSAISLLEPSVAWLIETFHLTRARATLISGGGVWLLGLGTVFSFNLWEHFKIFGLNFFDFLDYLTSNVLLPIGGLGIAIFCAWSMNRRYSEAELNMKPKPYGL